MKKSAGILLYRKNNNGIELLLVHPGGPYYIGKDDGCWSIPKGEINQEDKDYLATAKREFFEELGVNIDGHFIALNPVKQSNHKTIYIFVMEKDINIDKINSNCFEMEYPVGSNNYQQFPEIDKAKWFDIDIAKRKILKGQINVIDQLLKIINNRI